jgi:hypothetical protein
MFHKTIGCAQYIVYGTGYKGGVTKCIRSDSVTSCISYLTYLNDKHRQHQTTSVNYYGQQRTVTDELQDTRSPATKKTRSKMNSEQTQLGFDLMSMSECVNAWVSVCVCVWMNAWVTEWENEWLSSVSGRECVSAWANECVSEWMRECVCEWVNKSESKWLSCVSGWVSEWVSAWVSRWVS